VTTPTRSHAPRALAEIPTEHPCSRCGQSFPASNFYRNNHNRFGVDYWCKNCRRAVKANQASRGSTCVFCHQPIPAERAHMTTCQRNCALQSVGLPPWWDISDLDRATEQEIRNTLDAIILAASSECRKVRA
jgi:hypothetical protein